MNDIPTINTIPLQRLCPTLTHTRPSLTPEIPYDNPDRPSLTPAIALLL